MFWFGVNLTVNLIADDEQWKKYSDYSLKKTFERLTTIANFIEVAKM